MLAPYPQEIGAGPFRVEPLGPDKHQLPVPMMIGDLVCLGIHLDQMITLPEPNLEDRGVMGRVPEEPQLAMRFHRRLAPGDGVCRLGKVER